MSAPRNDRGRDYLGIHVLADDDPRWSKGPVEQAEAACAAGVPVVQLRVKHATDSQAVAWGHSIRRMTRSSGTRFVVNDRYDIALLCEADAVHLGQGDLPPAALPREARMRLAVGRSTHTQEQLLATREEDVDYVAFGPVFGTTSKDSEYSNRGLPALTEAIALAAPRPLVAIGGIGADDVAMLCQMGVGGIAVISVVAAAKDEVAAAKDLVARFKEAAR